MGLFFTAKKDSQVGVDFLPNGVAVAQVGVGGKTPGKILRSEYVAADGQEAQVEALSDWVRANHLQKTPCICLVAGEDCDIYQVEKPEVEDEELVQAVTWKIKDLINYDVANAVVDSYPMPVSSKNTQIQLGVVAAREAVVRNYIDGIKSSAMHLSALDIHDLVRSNLELVRQGTSQSLALLTLSDDSGLLSIYQNGDLYVSRDFKIGLEQLAAADDESVFDALLLELQRSTDYFESFYGMGAVNNLRVFPQLNITEKMAMYLQNLTNYDIDFVAIAADDDGPGLEPHCFHAYCAALRGVNP